MHVESMNVRYHTMLWSETILFCCFCLHFITYNIKSFICYFQATYLYIIVHLYETYKNNNNNTIFTVSRSLFQYFNYKCI